MTVLNDEEIEQIARVCHEANRALQINAGETEISPHFDEAPGWQIDSAKVGVGRALLGTTPEDLHDEWTKYKRHEGWTYGTLKDSVALTHPCLVAYADLPESQKIKDHVFSAIVGAFKEAGEVVASETGWFEWFKMPQNTTHIAYVYESRGIYLPEDGVSYKDFFEALSNGKVYRLIREEPAIKDYVFSEIDGTSKEVGEAQ